MIAFDLALKYEYPNISVKWTLEKREVPSVAGKRHIKKLEMEAAMEAEENDE